MPEVTEVLERDAKLFFRVLDTLGREFTFSFEEEETNEYCIKHVYLPPDTSWNVEIFQEMIDVREHVSEHFDNLHYELCDASFDLKQVRYAPENPLEEP